MGEKQIRIDLQNFHSSSENRVQMEGAAAEAMKLKARCRKKASGQLQGEGGGGASMRGSKEGSRPEVLQRGRISRTGFNGGGDHSLMERKTVLRPKARERFGDRERRKDPSTPIRKGGQQKHNPDPPPWSTEGKCPWLGETGNFFESLSEGHEAEHTWR